MRPDDFFDDGFTDPLLPGGRRRFRRELVRELRRGPIIDLADAEAAVALARLLHDDLEAFGTDGGELLNDEDMREGLLALSSVVERVGLQFNPPFRNFKTFRSYWLKNDGYGSWQARRDILSETFDELHDHLADLESRGLASSLANAISPRGRTGWARVDGEIAELRRHFQIARTAQDYRNVGNDCVIVTEALSRTVYRPDQHLREGETEPPISNTKQRLDRFVEEGLPGADNATLRKLTRAAIEVAQAVKHRTTPTRKEAGMAADTVILLANLLRRIDEEDINQQAASSKEAAPEAEMHTGLDGQR
jgi:hypothetical protein